VVAASREKKRKEQEKKFFQIAKNKLTAEVCIPPYYADFCISAWIPDIRGH
jgi:hypothetical protein